MAAGTPVVAVNIPIKPAAQYADVISSADNRAFAEFVTKEVGTTGSVAILGGLAGSATLQARYQPFIDLLKATAPNVRLLGPEFEKLDRTAAASISSALMLANPDLKAIYAISGPAGAGAASAVQQMGKRGQIKVFSYDATPEVVQGLRTGSITAALAQSPAKLGPQAVKVAIDAVKAKKNGAIARDESKNVTIPTIILTAQNVDSPEAADFFYHSECR
jgi:ABC-type sugar transport system substrate-binding protein